MTGQLIKNIIKTRDDRISAQLFRKFSNAVRTDNIRTLSVAVAYKKAL